MFELSNKSVVSIRNCSHKLDVSERVLEQRIANVEREYAEKYNNAKEQLKIDHRLTIDALVKLDENTL